MDTRWQQCNGYLFFIEMMCENFPKGMKVIIKTRAGNKFKGMFVIMIFINRQNMQLKLGKIKNKSKLLCNYVH